jgi:predicted O-methyltransferase YrrM
MAASSMMGAITEKTETSHHCHVPEERGWLFHSEDTQTTEDEYLHLLHSLVYCLKPLSVLETGTFKGYGTAAMAKALKRNGTGHLVSVEVVPDCVKWGREMLRVNDVADWATIVELDSLDFLKTTTRTFDFALFDSQLPLRCKELKICIERSLLKSGSMCALHDTSRLRTMSAGTPDPQTPLFWKELEELSSEYGVNMERRFFGRIKFIEFPYSRGLVLAQVL